MRLICSAAHDGENYLVIFWSRSGHSRMIFNGCVMYAGTVRLIFLLQLSQLTQPHDKVFFFSRYQRLSSRGHCVMFMSQQRFTHILQASCVLHRCLLTGDTTSAYLQNCLLIIKAFAKLVCEGIWFIMHVMGNETHLAVSALRMQRDRTNGISCHYYRHFTLWLLLRIDSSSHTARIKAKQDIM